MSSVTALELPATSMVSRYLRRGVAAGTVAGTIMAGYLSLMFWLPIHHAETGRHHHSAETAFTLSTMIDIGSSVLWGVLLGLIFALVYFIFEHSLPGSARVKPYTLALAGFVTVSGGPWLLLPPTPETVVQPLGATTRILLYLGGMAGGAVATSGSFYLYRRISAGSIGRQLLVSLTPIWLLITTSIALHLIILPVSIPAESASVIVVVATGQLLLWLVIATAFSVQQQFRLGETTDSHSNSTAAAE